ncbi:MAG: acyl-CoA dehydrogenase [Kaistia sp. SCN 65-12]|uniref:acyl-CoA dehydrogenase family protein n=1 Tax=Hyphomicrobium sp. CS1BSMeth3 TaxID=1892844 RepID=UPI00086F4EB4|nr:acyl-CoA dehydrogenase family protein [Hyphomicrobium sp. CS1BSMeth3]ODT22612.1 MAG: acyl-CoA dehydrogenase [Kaistia sp. SCN 65-12]
MNFEPSEEQKLLRHSVAAFIKQHCSRTEVRRWDEEGTFPEELYAAMVDAGYIAMVVPEAYGGVGARISDIAIVLEEIARPSVDFATRLALISWGSMILSEFASDEMKGEILPRVLKGTVKLSFSLTEPGSGSDAASLQTRAAKLNGDWVLNGQKLYASGAHAKDNMIIVAARTGTDGPKHAGISLFLVPNGTPGVTVRRLNIIGRRILGLCEVYFDDVRIPNAGLVGNVNEGWQYIVRHLERERIMLAANYLGSASSAVEDATAYARERAQFGRPISKFQAIAHMLADMATDLEAGRWMTALAAWRYDARLPCVREACMAKLFVSEMLNRVTTQGMQILGGAAYTYDHDMQRYWRDGRNATIGGGTSQIQRELIARELGL